MKKIVSVVEMEGEGLEALLGEQVILFCLNYFYAGKLVGINDKFVQLEDGGIVYETGEFASVKWKDFQHINKYIYVMIDKIEAFSKGK